MRQGYWVRIHAGKYNDDLTLRNGEDGPFLF